MSGVPGLIGGSATSDFRNAPAAAAIGCATSVREADLVLLTWVPFEVVIAGMFSGDQVE